MEINDITGVVVDSAMKAHTLLGPGTIDSLISSSVHLCDPPW